MRAVLLDPGNLDGGTRVLSTETTHYIEFWTNVQYLSCNGTTDGPQGRLLGWVWFEADSRNCTAQCRVHDPVVPRLTASSGTRVGQLSTPSDIFHGTRHVSQLLGELNMTLPFLLSLRIPDSPIHARRGNERVVRTGGFTQLFG